MLRRQLMPTWMSGNRLIWCAECLSNEEVGSRDEYPVTVAVLLTLLEPSNTVCTVFIDSGTWFFKTWLASVVKHVAAHIAAIRCVPAWGHALVLNVRHVWSTAWLTVYCVCIMFFLSLSLKWTENGFILSINTSQKAQQWVLLMNGRAGLKSAERFPTCQLVFVCWRTLTLDYKRDTADVISLRH